MLLIMLFIELINLYKKSKGEMYINYLNMNFSLKIFIIHYNI